MDQHDLGSRPDLSKQRRDHAHASGVRERDPEHPSCRKRAHKPFLNHNRFSIGGYDFCRHLHRLWVHRRETRTLMLKLISIALCFLTTPAFAQRITLASHQPIMATSQTAKSTLYVDCWKHHNNDSLTYWNGSADVNVPIPGCEISIALQAGGTGVLNPNDVFDVMYTASGPCLPTNGSGAGWSGDAIGSLTKRGTGYSAIDE